MGTPNAHLKNRSIKKNALTNVANRHQYHHQQTQKLMNELSLIFVLAAGIMRLFSLFRVGILLFGRKDISAECGSVPNHETNECPSKAAGICPTEKDDALDMALTFTKFNKIKRRNESSSESSDPQL